MFYGMLPHSLGVVDAFCPEMCFYQYLPLKMPGRFYMGKDIIEPRLHWTADIIGKCCCDYVALRGLDDFYDSYVYLTAKKMWQSAGCSYNRKGWHSDGFMTDDVNYIWSDKNPTVFNATMFKLTQDDTVSLREMEEQAKSGLDVEYGECELLRLTQYNIHRVAESTVGCMRTFIKVSISKDKYDLTGNSHNYLLDYSWDMRNRKIERNVPQCVQR